MGAELWKSESVVLTRTYDFAVDGGAVSAIKLGADLPDNFIMQKMVIETVTALVSGSGTATLGEDGAGDVDGYNADLVAGSLGVAYAGGALIGAAPHKVAAANDGIQLEILTGAVTAGKFHVYIHGYQSQE